MRATIDVAIRSQIMNVEHHLLELQSGMFAMRNEMRAIASLWNRRIPAASHVEPERTVARREEPKL
jgi:hypothetical protein